MVGFLPVGVVCWLVFLVCCLYLLFGLMVWMLFCWVRRLIILVDCLYIAWLCIELLSFWFVLFIDWYWGSSLFVGFALGSVCLPTGCCRFECVVGFVKDLSLLFNYCFYAVVGLAKCWVYCFVCVYYVVVLLKLTGLQVMRSLLAVRSCIAGRVCYLRLLGFVCWCIYGCFVRYAIWLFVSYFVFDYLLD